jgi:hypothetical protein
MTPAEKAFRELRETWFCVRLKSYSGEREWEDEERALIRENQNDESKKRYDNDTEAILRGEEAPVSPSCCADLYRGQR